VHFSRRRTCCSATQAQSPQECIGQRIYAAVGQQHVSPWASAGITTALPGRKCQSRPQPLQPHFMIAVQTEPDGARLILANALIVLHPSNGCSPSDNPFRLSNVESKGRSTSTQKAASLPIPAPPQISRVPYLHHRTVGPPKDHKAPAISTSAVPRGLHSTCCSLRDSADTFVFGLTDPPLRAASQPALGRGKMVP
jgi:hypothetical protein